MTNEVGKNVHAASSKSISVNRRIVNVGVELQKFAAFSTPEVSIYLL